MKGRKQLIIMTINNKKEYKHYCCSFNLSAIIASITSIIGKVQ